MMRKNSLEVVDHTWLKLRDGLRAEILSPIPKNVEKQKEELIKNGMTDLEKMMTFPSDLEKVLQEDLKLEDLFWPQEDLPTGVDGLRMKFMDIKREIKDEILVLTIVFRVYHFSRLEEERRRRKESDDKKKK